MDPALASRGISGILTPTSASSPNGPVRSTLSKKRRSDGTSIHNTSWQPFEIKPHPSSHLDRSRTLSPILLVPRSNLTLAYLDCHTISSVLTSTRLFSAQVECLESSRRQKPTELIPSVLVARLDSNGCLYAIERVQQGLYAWCKLGSWVTLEQLQEVASFVLEEACDRGCHSRSINDFTKWDSAKLGSSVAQRLSSVKRRQLDMDHPLRSSVNQVISEAKVDTLQEPEQQQQQPSFKQATDPRAQLPAQCPMGEVVVTEADPRETYSMVQTQYLESLYLSKASLAYFPKGPLSRARAALSKDDGGTLTSGLAAFLQSMVLSPSIMDQKYRESLPSYIQCLSPPGLWSDGAKHGTGAASERPKNRKSKKLGPAKDGLYRQEKDYITRWWNDTDDDLVSLATTRDDMIKKKLTILRLRESKLQLIVILELLAQQTLSTGGTKNSKEKSVLAKDIGPTKKTKSSRRRKPHDLDLTLDLLLDRLCIWQTVSFDGLQGACPDGRQTISEVKSVGTGDVDESDDLRDFYTEVILPFYGARLPEQCAIISRKLGDPNTPSPACLSSSKRRPHTALGRRPGAVPSNNNQSQPRRTLKRMLTDEARSRLASRRPSVLPSLTRSATAPAASHSKREGTETPFSAVSARESQSLPVSRGGILGSERLGQREVDFCRNANRAETKRATQAAIKDELKGAIATLKKPNRGLAVQEYVNSCDRRTLDLSKNGRMSRRPAGALAGRSVQVEATPRVGRIKNIAAMTTPISVWRDSAIPPSDLCVPSSALRPPPLAAGFKESNATELQETPQRPRYHALTIDETPCHRPSKTVIVGSCESELVRRSLPSMVRMGTPTREDLSRVFTNNQDVFIRLTACRTPLKPVRQGHASVFASPAPKQGANSALPKEMSMRSTGEEASYRPLMKMAEEGENALVVDGEPSLYTQLGWDVVDELT